MRLIAAIVLGKFIAYLSRKFRIGGGSAAPGLFALRIDPELIERLSKKIPKNIVITGTNGKTTTARMLAHFAKANGLKVIRNHTGSNLERGIASTLIQGVQLTHPGGVLNRHLGIWELDEAAFNNVVPKLNPDIVVFLNVFRDQLDRYGEVDSVVKKWSETLRELPKQTLVLVNGDDVNCAKLNAAFKGTVYQFGVKDYKVTGESIGYKKELEKLECEAINVKLKGLSGSSFSVVIHDKPTPVFLPLPGIYHIYDFLAAFYLGHELGFSTKGMIKSLKNFSPAFGRVEKLDFGYIFLIKNPAGATQVFETIAPNLKQHDRLLLALNDNIADGTDVSWIWDGDFEELSLRGAKRRGNLDSVFVSGTRAYDLAVRLKYAGFDPKSIVVQPELENALKQAKKGLKGNLFILPTYTAMLGLQKILAKSGLKKHYWEEE
ncbi:hypothetical protein A3B45_01065 [Candidatus Daviesbacteria bacterium RIFCSPLOWO2_01_FULL_39_12]|uniref:Lipid II isoglutaminyl synthase (glutamine-hydrolyzing) subunit MurT n=1 Tax=Candidatus Daviesbacteria bacterium RIFCSPLOWO2_01_FULL_39_12 TaxID=1797785 RepID=A0A1F5KT99_9BACT|nr:MAG: hypothetical protein A3D79_02995 [Candidatus Daviesbacteria bacterium RIFCSPHIGHO2_02_FULL_39_8]OGE44157.1 MAG: hypothetical protein A3B45_01065 [Candidatus Daviesbacteria bacterium RIFCSPLOWO2_01_FULL_39_12]